jgi:AAHS family 4-hydroxybenzoate transporter-like MFS transporter
MGPKDLRTKVDISELVDNSRLGSFQIGIFILCGLCLIMDGFDVQAMGYVAPALIRDWHIPAASMGPVFSAAPLGVLIGSLLFSMLADKIGRRPVLIGAAVFFSALTLLTARTTSVTEMFFVRLFAGMGMGAIMPNAVALCGEYSPRASRVAVMMNVANGFTIGAAFGGFVAAKLIPSFGWPSVFYFGGAVPLLISVLMLLMLPESLPFLVLQGGKDHQIQKWVTRIEPSAPVAPDFEYVVHERRKTGVPIVTLFAEGRALGTLLLWTANFMNLLNLYFLSSWLPIVASQGGYSTSGAVLVGTTFQVGGAIGAMVLGWFIARMGFTPVLAACFTVGCLAIASIGQPALAPALLFAIVFIAGFGVPGGQAGVNALVATYYPTRLRSTGVGSALGVGRMGAIVGPGLGGYFMSLRWSTHQLFLAAAIPALISALVIISMHWLPRQKEIAAPETVPG